MPSIDLLDICSLFRIPEQPQLQPNVTHVVPHQYVDAAAIQTSAEDILMTAQVRLRACGLLFVIS